MKFNRYIWDIFRNSDEGKKDIEVFQNVDINRLSDRFGFEIGYFYDEENKLQSRYEFAINALKNQKVSSFQQARKLFSDEVIEKICDHKFNGFIESLETFSTAWFQSFPEYFIPYYFNSETYPDFVSICENLGIILPPIPTRHNWVNRTWYYFEICETLHNFRKKFGIEATEFPVLFYSFGFKIIEKEKEEDLPKPSRIYFLGAGANAGKGDDNWDFNFLDNSERNSTAVWGAGNLNIKKGDLVLIYCVSPRQYLHSIWRALEDSFIDPFRYHYYCVKVGFPHKIKPVHFQELKENRIFKNNSTVKSQMQGMNGRPLTAKEYAELLRMIGKKGQNTDLLPKLPVYNREIDHIENEADVEQQLIEPLLKDLGFRDYDWMRQMPLRMGRQTKYYPDYAIKANALKGKEKAQIVLEAKYSISSEKQLQEAFDQARSYGLRLQSEKIVLADRDFLWIYEKNKDDFDSTPILRVHWNELSDSDMLFKLKTILK